MKQETNKERVDRQNKCSHIYYNGDNAIKYKGYCGKYSNYECSVCGKTFRE